MSKQARWVLTFIIILAFAAIACQACSGADEEAGNQEGSASSNVDEESSGTDQSEDTASSEAGDDTSGSGSEGDQSAIESGEDEPVDESATAAPVEPTLIPSDEPPQETEDPSGEDSADESGVNGTEDGQEAGVSDGGDSGEDSADSGGSDSSGGSSVAGGPSQTACDHPYLPLRTGATWTYNNDGETLTWEVVDVQGDQNNATAVLRIITGDITLDTNWSCSSDEGLSSYNFADYGFGDLGADMTIEQTSADGSFLLPADQLVPGATWDLNMENAINYTQEAAGETLVVTGDMINVQSNEVVGVEPVEFDGQTVDGIQVQQENGIDLVITVLGNSIEQNMSVTNSYNFGKGIGIVNQTSITDFGPGTLQLISYHIP